MRRSLTSLAAAALMLALAGTPAVAQDSLRVTGSGASFPFPIYSAWFKAFSSKAKTISVDYQGKGSGAGVQDFINIPLPEAVVATVRKASASIR